MTSNSDWQRARKPSQKEARREEILGAAKRLFAKLSYEDVSLNQIAREAGMSKPNVYRYFSSREEIFLQILGEEQHSFLHRLAGRLKDGGGENKLDHIVEAWLDVSLESPDLLALLPQLGLSMEKNSSLEQLVAYKRETFEGGRALAVVHQALYPQLSLGRWVEVINCTVGMMAGLWPLCNGNELLEQAMRHPDVGLQPWDFRQMMGFGMKSLIRGASI